MWAVGECAEHRGTVYGLWAPVLEQARAAGAAIAGRPERLPRRGPGHDAEGRRHRPLLRGRAPPSPTRSPRRSSSLDSRRERYRKLVLRDGALAGATLLGDVGDARRLRALIASGEAVPEDLLDAGGPTSDEPADHLVCSCQVVSRSDDRHRHPRP